jgi:hypothetical protein
MRLLAEASRLWPESEQADGSNRPGAAARELLGSWRHDLWSARLFRKPIRSSSRAPRAVGRRDE